MTKHQPATPLPWKISGLGYLSNNKAVIAATEHVPNLGEQYRHIPMNGVDAAYIVHAANSYPRLIEALQWAHQQMTGRGSALRRRFAGQKLDAQTALLRELGEAE